MNSDESHGGTPEYRVDWRESLTPASSIVSSGARAEGARVFEFDNVSPASLIRTLERIARRRELDQAFAADRRIEFIDQGVVAVPPYAPLVNPAPTLPDPVDVRFGNPEFGQPDPYALSEFGTMSPREGNPESHITVGKLAVKYMTDNGWTFAAALLAHYFTAEKIGIYELGSEYVFTPAQMEKVVHSPWVMDALYNGQSYVVINPGEHPDLKAVKPDTPGAHHDPGMNDIIAQQVERARNDESLYGQPIPFEVPWMRTTDKGYEDDKRDKGGPGEDIHNALGHYTVGASGTMILSKADDGSVNYTVVYNVQAWDFYTFAEMAERSLESEYADADDPTSLMARLKQSGLEAVNNVMVDAHRLGVARNFIDHGESLLRVRRGVVGSDGKIGPAISDELLEP